MRDVHPWPPHRPGDDEEPGGEGQHGREDVAVGQPDRQGVGRAVGHAAHGQPGQVHVEVGAVGDFPEHPVEEPDVGAEPAGGDQVPGRRQAGVGRHQHHAVPVGGGEHGAEVGPARAGRPVQEDEERRARLGRLGDVEHAVALGAEPERLVPTAVGPGAGPGGRRAAGRRVGRAAGGRACPTMAQTPAARRPGSPVAASGRPSSCRGHARPSRRPDVPTVRRAPVAGHDRRRALPPGLGFDTRAGVARSLAVMAAPGGTGPIGPFPARVAGDEAQDDYDKTAAPAAVDAAVRASTSWAAARATVAT